MAYIEINGFTKVVFLKVDFDEDESDSDINRIAD